MKLNLGVASSTVYLHEMKQKAKDLKRPLYAVIQCLKFEDEEEFRFMQNLNLAVDLLARFDEFIE